MFALLILLVPVVLLCLVLAIREQKKGHQSQSQADSVD